MKKFILVVVTLFIVQFTFSQSPFGASTPLFGKNLFYIDLNGGLLIPSMNFADTPFDQIESQRFFGQTFGLSFRIQFQQHFSFSTQFSYRELGSNFLDNRNYRIRANYLNLFTPLEYDLFFSSKPKSTAPNLMLFAGPYFAYNLGGSINSDLVNGVELSESEIAQLDYGLEGGVGVRIPTFSFSGKSHLTIKASYFRGLANTFPVELAYEAQKADDLMLSSNGIRVNQGIRLAISYEFSLAKKEMTTFTAGGDGKKTYKRYIVK